MEFEIDHLGIAVRSLQEGLAFYSETLGMNVSHQEIVPNEGVKVAMLPAGTQARLELLESTDDASVIARFIRKHGPGLHHVAIKVENLALSIDKLRQQGATLLNEPRLGVGGHTYVFVHPKSTGGVLLELIQKPDLGKQDL